MIICCLKKLQIKKKKLFLFMYNLKKKIQTNNHVAKFTFLNKVKH